MGTMERVVGAVVGFAVGDAVGAQVRGVEDPFGALIVADHLETSCCTDQLVLAARALLAVTDPEDEGALLGALSKELAGWYHHLEGDPPSSTTLAAVARLLSGLHPASVGDPHSDGATSVLRAVPVGLVCAPDHLWLPARTVAEITHQHPNAQVGAMAVGWLVSRVVRGAPLTAELVLEVAEQLGGLADEVVGALHAGIALAEDLRREDRGPRATDMKELDGGVRAASALGLAVAVALKRAPERSWRAFERAVGEAARLPGGDIVASLVGALLGAAWGAPAVSRHLVDNLAQESALVDLGRALHRRAGIEPMVGPDEVTEPGGFDGRPAAHGLFVSEDPDDDAMDVAWLMLEKRAKAAAAAKHREEAERERLAAQEAEERSAEQETYVSNVPVDPKRKRLFER